MNTHTVFVEMATATKLVRNLNEPCISAQMGTFKYWSDILKQEHPVPLVVGVRLFQGGDAARGVYIEMQYALSTDPHGPSDMTLDTAGKMTQFFFNLENASKNWK